MQYSEKLLNYFVFPQTNFTKLNCCKVAIAKMYFAILEIAEHERKQTQTVSQYTKKTIIFLKKQQFPEANASLITKQI